MDTILRRDLLEAASRLQEQADLIERMQSELAQAISERTPHDYGLLKYTIEALKEELHKSREELAKVKRESVNSVTVSFPGMPSSGGGGGGRSAYPHGTEVALPQKPEPSRLEIAALLASGLNPCWNFSVEALFHRTDAIIAAAKEVTK